MGGRMGGVIEGSLRGCIMCEWVEEDCTLLIVL